MKALVSLNDFSQASGVKNALLANGIMHLSGLHKLNSLYSKLFLHKGLHFTSAFFDQYNITLEINEDELERIPASGPFITISNHPFGGADGLALLDLVARKRGDFKIMGNFLLGKIEPLTDYFIPVNPFETHRHVNSSISGMKQAHLHLKEGHALGIFPAGEVSTYQGNGTQIGDREWQRTAIKLIRNANVPVIPVYFHGHNSWSFHMLGKIHPQLRTLRLPHELTALQNAIIKIRIGSPILPREQNTFTDIDAFGKYLRVKTYSLGSALLPKKSIFEPLVPVKPAPVIESAGKKNIAEEIAAISHLKILSQQNFDLYLAKAQSIPHILREIGRLREITFRMEGEGTNKKIDLDRYDKFYHHLFLYDRDARQIAGAYRIGKGDEIMQSRGMKGFYTNSLFRMKMAMAPVLSEAIELGRSFIIPEYQNKRLPLLLLWRGVYSVMISNSSYRYVIGPVSISNAYSAFSKSVLVAFIQRHYFDDDLAAYVKPRKKYKLDSSIIDEAELLLGPSGNDLRKLDRIIHDIEPAIKSAPVLLKKYIEQNAKIISFNVDPKFNQSLDGLMMLNINKIPVETLENLKNEMSV